MQLNQISPLDYDLFCQLQMFFQGFQGEVYMLDGLQRFCWFSTDSWSIEFHSAKKKGFIVSNMVARVSENNQFGGIHKGCFVEILTQ